MSESGSTDAVDPMDDPARHGKPPTDADAVEAANRMNDADGPQPGVVDDPPEPSDDDPLPELPG